MIWVRQAWAVAAMLASEMGWSNIINVALSVVLGGAIAYQLFKREALMNLGQRLGLGLWGAAVVLSIAPQVDVGHHITPFSNWYQCLWRVGGILFMISSAIRDRRHDKAGKAAELAIWAKWTPEQRAEHDRRKAAQTVARS